MAHRYFLDTIMGDTAQITDKEANHLIKVMRISLGDTVILCDKDGYDYFGKVCSIDDDVVEVTVLQKERNKAEPTTKG